VTVSTEAPEASRRVTRRSYRKGSSGDQRRAFGTGTANSVKPPVVVETTWPPPMASARTVWPVVEPRVKTLTRAVPVARSGRMSTEWIEVAGVGSSQTDCQMPLVGV
jgi:hypothetical protein